MDDFLVLDARADRTAVLRDPRLSSSPDTSVPANLLFMDGEEHRRLREVVKEVIALTEPLPAEVGAGIEEIVSGLADRAEFDLVADFGLPVAALVAAAVLGAGPFDDRFLAALSETTANLNVWSGEASPAGDVAALRVAMFFLKAPAAEGGGLALLRRACAEGRISEDELMVTPVMLAHAAYENSMNFLAVAGLGMVTTPGRCPGAAEVRGLVQEIAPTRYAARRATGECVIAGRPLEPGAKVAIPLGDGLAFGLGRHACPGSRVAVAEGEIALRALARVLTPDHTVTEVAWKAHPVFHGLASAQVVVRVQAG
ncbi:cytochrome P450 [Amycolatopsis balhimycina DSM 5908]|uniref:Cytochrome P450 n=1 Tax=Amycolatopsis balhimycina DSM 5908 TaxID=1081091 RepID=A0A428X4G7_AMYBA|nr:cytochrome P450 [Amycolatopsis balhimycina]RSM50223.1 cytochrome P450 [Amycolatopsis balhimycina DSM 5908]